MVWNVSNHLPEGLSYASSVVYNNRVYVFGGTKESGASNRIYYAPFVNGILGEWITDPLTLSHPVSGASAIVNNGYIYVMGGITTGFTKVVISIKVNNDGSVFSIDSNGDVALGALPEPLAFATSITNNGYIYIMGGTTTGGATNKVYYTQQGLLGQGLLSPWTLSTSLPSQLTNATSIVNNNYVYVMGGTASGNMVYYAPLVNGILGSWITSPNRLPGTGTGATSIVHNNYIYVIAAGNGNARNKVYYAQINSPVGVWNVSPYELPNGFYAAMSILYDNYVYVMGGGNNSGVLNTVYYANVSELIPTSNVCFPAGTPVETDQGILSIEKINPDIHTIHKCPLVITKTITDETYLVNIKKNALGVNYPSANTTLSQNHKVMYNGKMRTANQLIHHKNVSKVNYNGDPLYNVLMEEYSYIRVNNLICETLDPHTIIANLYKREDKPKGKRKTQTLVFN